MEDTMFLKIILLTVSGFFIACQAQKGSETPQSPQPKTHHKAALFFKNEMKLQTCSIDIACPTGFECAYLDLKAGTQASCVNSETICEQLGCEQGSCTAAFSYPMQIHCVD
jgi:hypothetical protein